MNYTAFGETYAELRLLGRQYAHYINLRVQSIHTLTNMLDYSGKALIAFTGIDFPTYQSGQFTGANRHISKRGSALLRKTGFEIMKCIKCSKPENGPVFHFMLKKEAEGKAPKLAMIAGLNKFLRIYYARVKEAYSA